MNTETPRKIIQISSIALFILFISTHIAFEIAHRSGSTVLNLQPYPKYYSNVAGILRPNLSASVYGDQISQYHYSVSNSGFRNNGITSSTSPLKHSVYCLGDSFTFGVGVSDAETYPAALERTLNRIYGPLRISVINAGSVGTGLGFQSLHYIDKIKHLDHDLVIQQFYYFSLINTHKKNVYINSTSIKSKPFHHVEDSTLANDIDSWILNHVGTIGIIKNITSLIVATGQSEYSPEANKTTFKPPYTVTEEMRKILDSPDLLLDERNYSVIKPAWDTYLSQLLEFKDEVESTGKQFLFIIIPDKLQLDSYRNAPSAVLSNFCDTHNIRYIDFTDTFRSLYLHQGINPFRDYDFHCNAVGNAIIADEISKRIAYSETEPKNPFEISQNTRARIYRNPRTIILSMDDYGTFSLQDNDFIELLHASYDNTLIRREAGGGIRYITTNIANKATSAINLTFAVKSKFKQVTSVFVPHINGSGYSINKMDVILTYGGSASGFSTAQLGNPLRYNDFDIRAFLEGHCLDTSASTFELTINMLRDAGMSYGDANDPTRHIELYVYEADQPDIPSVHE